jgi:hypothetical protein
MIGINLADGKRRTVAVRMGRTNSMINVNGDLVEKCNHSVS